ncbi:MAG: hypothetical protein JSU61_13105 [Fidelibacterota bacterium]|nr:MAG: hypothetical protein JSU61_13105 [Candidatus Neomarinimicrobiota bacterium]
MAGIAHLSVGLAAKPAAPRIPVGILILAAYGIDIVFLGFMAAGLEHFPKEGVVVSAPWSHGLFMAVIWSVVAGVIANLITKDQRTAVIIGLLFFSHWLVDFISHPMTAIFPGAPGLKVFFHDSPEVGLGLYRTQLGANLFEYGTLAVGLGIYIFTLIRLRRKKKLATEE